MDSHEMEPATFREDQKKGYLYQDFRYFHLREQKSSEFSSHYHDFYKIVVFLSGSVTYTIEGKSYFLKPGDILLVNRYDLHRLSVDGSEPYERIILWLRLDFIQNYRNRGCDLASCFGSAREKRFHLLRLKKDIRDSLFMLLTGLEKALEEPSGSYGAHLLTESLLIQFLIQLNRIYLGNTYIKDRQALHSDKRIEAIIRYINSHLSDSLTADLLASRFYFSKSYLMRKFKSETGYSLHQYILQKRLFMAADLIRGGCPSTQAAAESGFGDYSVFLKAFKKLFQCLPSNYLSQTEDITSSIK